MLETIVKADMVIIESFMMSLVIAIIFYVANYLAFKNRNNKILWGLIVISLLALIMNFIRVLMFYT